MNATKFNTQPVFVGKLIEAEVKRQGLSGARLAKAAGCSDANMYNIFKRPEIGVNMLLGLSRLLGHNFFRDLADLIDAKEQADVDADANSAASVWTDEHIETYCKRLGVKDDGKRDKIYKIAFYSYYVGWLDCHIDHVRKVLGKSNTENKEE